MVRICCNKTITKFTPVEYTDPSGVFQSISQDLYKRLPLRNLHWNSSSRPLRSIKSLNVDLVPVDKRRSRLTNPPPSRGATVGENGAWESTTDLGKSDGRPTSSTDPNKERRHQIPGLRRTPYLKLYLLQCDDVDNYKSEQRKLLKEWVKEHTPPPQKSGKASKQENHDAFEWLIVHVVATRGTRSATPQGDNKTSSKRGPAYLVEKIRTDFNSTSKSEVDHVAQIQINEEFSGGPPLGQGPEDGDTGWGDLVFKLKTLILSSFDQRVKQYEEDIKEKESQRTLPGWNFNTFFVLKEGLAKGFESVGLVEDALTSYHELSLGLSSIVEERSSESTNAPAADTLRSHTEELLGQYKVVSQQQFRHLSGIQSSNESNNDRITAMKDVISLGDLILDVDRKPFRELILANKLSAFDFQCYIFARQVALLLRLANVSSMGNISPALNLSTDTFGEKSRDTCLRSPLVNAGSIEAGNLPMLAEICERTLGFVKFTSGTMRMDLWTGLGQSKNEDAIAKASHKDKKDIVDNLVASWIFSVSRRILQLTLTGSLSVQLQPLMGQLHSEGNDPVGPASQVKSPSQRHGFPDRSSSLNQSAASLKRPPSPEKYPSLVSLDAMRLLPPGPLQTGAQDLAAQRQISCSFSEGPLVIEVCSVVVGKVVGPTCLGVLGQSSKKCKT